MAKHTTNTHRERSPSLLRAGLNFLADYHSFAATERTLQLCLVQVFLGSLFPLPTLCEIGLIAGIWCKKNGYIYGYVFEPEPEPVPGQCCHWQNRTGHPSASNFAHMLRQSRCMRQQLQLQLHQLQHYRVSERARERDREGEGDVRDGRVIYCRTDWETAKCVWASVSAAAVVAAEA